MWFAALGGIQHNAWLQSLAVRLLQGKQDALDLLASKQDDRIQVPPEASMLLSVAIFVAI